MTLGDAFVNLNPTSRSHLWVVISNETPEGWIIVNLTTRRPPCDDSCIVRPGDHPWVSHDSIVGYARAQMLSQIAVDAMNQLRCYDPKQRVSRDLLSRIQEGALASPYTKKKFKLFIRVAIAQHPM